MRSVFVILLITTSALLSAQEFDFLHFGLKNNIAVNTANAGLISNNTITAHFLREELGFGHNEHNIMYQRAFKANKWIHGVGAHFFYGDYGIEYFNAALSYSVGYKLGNEHYIHLGIGLNNNFRYFGNLTFPDQTDPFYGFVTEPTNSPKWDYDLYLSNGIWYNYHNLILQAQFTDWYVPTADIILDNKFSYSLAYSFDLNHVELTPALGYGQFDRDLPPNPYIELNLVYNKFLLLGGTLQYEGYTKTMASVALKDWLNIGVQTHFFVNPNDHNGIGLINYQLALQTRF